ncbi:MAG: sigma-70 family RNA polymerase sigma factor [Gemmataceae bacterium]
MSLGESLNTLGLHSWVAELQAGRPGAAEPEFLRILSRVERMTRTTFRRFSRVGRFVEPEDVVQNTMLRLFAALRQIRPASMRDFYALVNELIRREFLDLTRRYFGPQGSGRRIAAQPLTDADGDQLPPGVSPVADLDQFTAFHEALEQLPVEEREVIGLGYYHGWPQAQIAELFGVSTRTVQRWHEAGVAQIRRILGNDS